jgi:Fe-S cluster assembly ATPase SufC
MFAGPNGSGKSTLKSGLRPERLGHYINSDEIEQEFQTKGLLGIGSGGFYPTRTVGADNVVYLRACDVVA